MQLDAYRRLNKFGDKVRFNAFTLFQTLNQGRLKCGLSILLEPNEVVEPTPPVEITQQTITPMWIYVIIGIGALLVIAVIILIVRTRRVV